MKPNQPDRYNCPDRKMTNVEYACGEPVCHAPLSIGEILFFFMIACFIGGGIIVWAVSR